MQLSFQFFFLIVEICIFVEVCLHKGGRKQINYFCLHIPKYRISVYKSQFLLCVYVCVCVCVTFALTEGMSSLSVSDCVNSQTVSMHHSITYLHTFTYYRGYTKPFWCMFAMFRCLSSQRTKIMGKTLR
jgi:hypothetical protein